MAARSDAQIVLDAVRDFHIEVATRWEKLWWLYLLAGTAVGIAVAVLLKNYSWNEPDHVLLGEQFPILLGASGAVWSFAALALHRLLRGRALAGSVPMPVSVLHALRGLSPEAQSAVAIASEDAGGRLDYNGLLHLLGWVGGERPRDADPMPESEGVK